MEAHKLFLLLASHSLCCLRKCSAEFGGIRTCKTFNLNNNWINRWPVLCSSQWGAGQWAFSLQAELNLSSSKLQQWLAIRSNRGLKLTAGHFDNLIIFISLYRTDTDIHWCQWCWSLSMQQHLESLSLIFCCNVELQSFYFEFSVWV